MTPPHGLATISTICFLFWRFSDPMMDQYDADLAFALQLQEEEELATAPSPSPAVKAIKPKESKPNAPIVDGSWETIDPVPDVHALFLQFNDEYFFGKLNGVEVRWSPRMTRCAGLCSYEGRGGLCSVRLSEPLLKFRPRKDLVQTLLHEMIHAYLFVTANNKDHDAHGPEFLSHMHRINKLSGANITVYHDFIEEVNHYLTHWWKCDGPCQQRKPFFGYVKRSMNRAPGPNDTWWSEHETSCGGKYHKIKEPEGYVNKNKRKNDGVPGSVAKKRNLIDDASSSSHFVPFSGVGHVLGGTKSPQKTIDNFFSVKKKDDDGDDVKLFTIGESPVKRRDLSNTKRIYLSDYYKMHPERRINNRIPKRSVARKSKPNWRPPLYFSDDSDCEEVLPSPEKKKNLIDNIVPPMEDLSVNSSPVCPVCNQKVEQENVNQHLDFCLAQHNL